MFGGAYSTAMSSDSETLKFGESPSRTTSTSAGSQELVPSPNAQHGTPKGKDSMIADDSETTTSKTSTSPAASPDKAACDKKACISEPTRVQKKLAGTVSVRRTVTKKPAAKREAATENLAQDDERLQQKAELFKILSDLKETKITIDTNNDQVTKIIRVMDAYYHDACGHLPRIR